MFPRYKYRQEGEKVQYKDQVVLLNLKTNLNLHITESEIEKEQTLVFEKEEWRPKSPDRRETRNYFFLISSCLICEKI